MWGVLIYASHFKKEHDDADRFWQDRARLWSLSCRISTDVLRSARYLWGRSSRSARARSWHWDRDTGSGTGAAWLYGHWPRSFSATPARGRKTRPGSRSHYKLCHSNGGADG